MHQGVGLAEDFSINSGKRLGHFSPDRIDMRGGDKKPLLLIAGCVRSHEYQNTLSYGVIPAQEIFYMRHI